MGANQTIQRQGIANYVILDPGAGGVIRHSKQDGVVELISATAESRSVADPLKPGLRMTISMKVDGGDVTVSFTTAITEAGTTSVVFSDAGQVLKLESIAISTTACAWRVVSYDGVGGLSAGNVVSVTTSTITITEALHNKKTIVLDRAAGIAATLPSAAAGLDFEFLIKTTFAGAASIKSVVGTDIMIGHALMGNNSDNTVVDWQSIASATNDTIDLFGTANSTGGIEGQTVRIRGLASGLWHVAIRGDAAGSEATPFANTVA